MPRGYPNVHRRAPRGQLVAIAYRVVLRRRQAEAGMLGQSARKVPVGLAHDDPWRPGIAEVVIPPEMVAMRVGDQEILDLCRIQTERHDARFYDRLGFLVRIHCVDQNVAVFGSQKPGGNALAADEEQIVENPGRRRGARTLSALRGGRIGAGLRCWIAGSGRIRGQHVHIAKRHVQIAQARIARKNLRRLQAPFRMHLSVTDDVVGVLRQGSAGTEGKSDNQCEPAIFNGDTGFLDGNTRFHVGHPFSSAARTTRTARPLRR